MKFSAAIVVDWPQCRLRPREHPGKELSLVDRDSISRLLNCVHEVRWLHRLMRERLSEVAKHEGISDADLLTLLSCVGSDDGVHQRDLARRVGVSTAQMSGVVDRLKGLGFMEDRRASDDRRRVHWKVSQSGIELIERLSDCLELLERAVSGDVSTEYKLEKMRQSLARLPIPIVETLERERKRA